MTTRRGLLAAAAATALPPPAMAQPAPLRELGIGYQKNGLLYIDKQRGLIEARFRTQNAAVRWVEFTFGPPLLEALNVGSIDYGTVGDTPPVFAPPPNVRGGAGRRAWKRTPGVAAASPIGRAEDGHPGAGRGLGRRPGAGRPAQGPLGARCIAQRQ